jgi:hypothetical protein
VRQTASAEEDTTNPEPAKQEAGWIGRGAGSRGVGKGRTCSRETAFAVMCTTPRTGHCRQFDLANIAGNAPTKTATRLKRTGRTPTLLNQHEDRDDRLQSLVVEGASEGDRGWAEMKATFRSCEQGATVRAKRTKAVRPARMAPIAAKKIAPNFGGDANLRESEFRVKLRNGRWRRKDKGDCAANRRPLRFNMTVAQSL